MLADTEKMGMCGPKNTESNYGAGGQEWGALSVSDKAAAAFPALEEASWPESPAA